MNNPTCDRCGLEYIPAENALCPLGGHSADACIAALKKKVAGMREMFKVSCSDEEQRLTRELAHTKQEQGGYITQLQDARRALECVGKEFKVSPDCASSELAARIIQNIDRLRTQMPHVDNPGKTHYEGCWDTPGHHNCAVRVIQQMGTKAQEANKLIDEIRSLLDLKDGEPIPGNVKAGRIVLTEDVKVERTVNKQ